MKANLYFQAGEAVEPTSTVYGCDNGRRFAIIHIGGLSIHLPGFDLENVRAARAIAAELTSVADEIESAIAPAIASAPEAQEGAPL